MMLHFLIFFSLELPIIPSPDDLKIYNSSCPFVENFRSAWSPICPWTLIWSFITTLGFKWLLLSELSWNPFSSNTVSVSLHLHSLTRIMCGHCNALHIFVAANFVLWEVLPTFSYIPPYGFIPGLGIFFIFFKSPWLPSLVVLPDFNGQLKIRQFT